MTEEKIKVETKDGRTIYIKPGELFIGNFMLPDNQFPLPSEEAMEFVKNESYAIRLFLAQYYEIAKSNRLLNSTEESLKGLIESNVENLIKNCQRVLH
jgi:hypothetical protein